MIAMRRNCLAPNELQQVIQGDLSKEAFDSAVSHLDHCETCRSAIETIESPDGNPDDLSFNVSGEPDSLQNETACHVALQSLLDRQAQPKSPRPATPPPFDSLGPYRLLELLGSGGMGAVYLAEHQRLKRTCAIKLLPPDRVSQAGWLERFDREMTAIAALEHPNIVRATDAGHESGWHYLVMEYLDGMDVGCIASRMERLPIPDACEIVRQAALGLSHIHDAGLVHRDIKPSNLMMARNGTIKLLDLGLVLDGDDPLSMDERLTTVGHVMGTMPYMAPEQLADSRDVRPQSDIYSLGATLFRLIAGRPPHRCGKGLAAQVLAITHQDAPGLNEVREGVDRDVAGLVAQMLARDPDARPNSAAEIAQRLRPLAKGHRLKPLLRDATRRPDPDSMLATGFVPTSNPQNGSGRGNAVTRWLLGAAAAALFLVAGWVIKVQTDKGEVVFYGNDKTVTLAIKQGDELVRRLTLNNDNPDQIQLHKGSYDLEIEDEGQTLRLSQDNITVGRGSLNEISVLSDFNPDSLVIGTASPDPNATDSLVIGSAGGNPDGLSFPLAPSPDDSTPGLTSTNPLDRNPSLQAGVAAFESAEPAPSPEPTATFGDMDSGMSGGMGGGGGMGGFGGGMGGLSSNFDIVYRDEKSLRQWLKLVETEQDPEELGSAAFASIALLEDLSKRGMGTGTEKKRVVSTILHRSRELGGLDRKLPPLPGITETKISDSEHFMWYLTDLFGQPDLATWYESSIDELIDGNAKSRAAVIACLHRHHYNPAMSLRSSMGGMGGFQSSQAYQSGFDGMGTLARFTFSRLLRCCIGLGTENAWQDLPEKERTRAAKMAREVALKIPGQAGMQPEQMPDLVALLRTIPKDLRSREEDRVVDVAGYIEQDRKLMENGSDESTSTLGSTGDSKSPAHASPSAGSSPSILGAAGTASPAPVATPSSTPAQDGSNPSPSASALAPVQRLLYQGKDLDQWLDVLARERDGDSLIEAMKAVETLSRESDAATRLNAAQETLRLTRRLGGLVSGGNENPSHQFMAEFPDVFGRYLPAPGMDLIMKELDQDHFRSQIGSIRALSDFLSSNSFVFGDNSQAQKTSEWFDLALQDEAENQRLHAFRDRLLELAKSYRSDEFPREGFTDQPANYRESVAATATQTALQLSLKMGDEIANIVPFRTSTISSVKQYLINMERMGLDKPSFSNGSLLGQENTLAAILIAGDSIESDDGEITLTEPQWQLLAANLIMPYAISLDDVTAKAFEVLAREAPDALLVEIKRSFEDSSGYYGQWPILELAVPFFAENYEPAAEARQTIKKARDTLANPSFMPQKLLIKMIDRAEKTLDDRVKQAAQAP